MTAHPLRRWGPAGVAAFVVMIAHAAFDIAAALIIYWDLESAVAHLLIK